MNGIPPDIVLSKNQINDMQKNINRAAKMALPNNNNNTTKRNGTYARRPSDIMLSKNQIKAMQKNINRAARMALPSNNNTRQNGTYAAQPPETVISKEQIEAMQKEIDMAATMPLPDTDDLVEDIKKIEEKWENEIHLNDTPEQKVLRKQAEKATIYAIKNIVIHTLDAPSSNTTNDDPKNVSKVEPKNTPRVNDPTNISTNPLSASAVAAAIDVGATNLLIPMPKIPPIVAEATNAEKGSLISFNYGASNINSPEYVNISDPLYKNFVNATNQPINSIEDTDSDDSINATALATAIDTYTMNIKDDTNNYNYDDTDDTNILNTYNAAYTIVIENGASVDAAVVAAAKAVSAISRYSDDILNINAITKAAATMAYTGSNPIINSAAAAYYAAIAIGLTDSFSIIAASDATYNVAIKGGAPINIDSMAEIDAAINTAKRSVDAAAAAATAAAIRAAKTAYTNTINSGSKINEAINAAYIASRNAARKAGGAIINTINTATVATQSVAIDAGVSAKDIASVVARIASTMVFKAAINSRVAIRIALKLAFDVAATVGILCVIGISSALAITLVGVINIGVALVGSITKTIGPDVAWVTSLAAEISYTLMTTTTIIIKDGLILLAKFVSIKSYAIAIALGGAASVAADAASKMAYYILESIVKVSIDISKVVIEISKSAAIFFSKCIWVITKDFARLTITAAYKLAMIAKYSIEKSISFAYYVGVETLKNVSGITINITVVVTKAIIYFGKKMLVSLADLTVYIARAGVRLTYYTILGTGALAYDAAIAASGVAIIITTQTGIIMIDAMYIAKDVVFYITSNIWTGVMGRVIDTSNPSGPPTYSPQEDGRRRKRAGPTVELLASAQRFAGDLIDSHVPYGLQVGEYFKPDVSGGYRTKLTYKLRKSFKRKTRRSRV